MKNCGFAYINLLNELRLQPSVWRNYHKISLKESIELLSIVTPLTEKEICVR
jgi:hypothetical protein